MMALWSNDFFAIYCMSLLKLAKLGCNPSLRRGYSTHTKEIDILANNTHLRKHWSL